MEWNVCRQLSLETVGHRDCSIFSLLFIVRDNHIVLHTPHASSLNLPLPLCHLFCISYFIRLARRTLAYIGTKCNMQYVLFIFKVIEINLRWCNLQSGVPDMHETLSSFPEQFGDGPRKPEIKSEIPKETDRTADNLKCGWFWFRPIYLQKFRTAKWALFWLCWAGAMQGT